MTHDVVFPDVDFGSDPVEDIHARMALLHQRGMRIAKVKYYGADAWLIIRHKDVNATYRDEENLPAAPAHRRFSGPVMGQTLLTMEGEKHRINRLLVSGAFHPSAVKRMIPELLIPHANRLIDQLSSCREADIVKAFTFRYPFRVISHWLGIPVEDEERMLGWMQGMLLYPTDPEAALRAGRETTAYLMPLIKERRADPGNDLISSLVHATVEGERLTDEEILSFIRLLYPAGSDTTYLALGSMLYRVLVDPQVTSELRKDPSLRQQTVEESLRMDAAVCLQTRFTEKPVNIAGVDIPADSWLLYGNDPANHDPRVYPDPDRFDIQRCPKRVMTFGAGPHFCLGSHLARAEMRVSLTLLLDRLPGLRLAAGETGDLSGAILRGPHQLKVAFDDVLPPPDTEDTLLRI